MANDAPTAGHDGVLQAQAPPPPPPPPPSPWEALGLAFAMVGLAALIVFLILGSVYFLYWLSRKRKDDDDDEEAAMAAAAVEQQLAELPPAPRHDPRLARQQQ